MICNPHKILLGW